MVDVVVVPVGYRILELNEIVEQGDLIFAGGQWIGTPIYSCEVIAGVRFARRKNDSHTGTDE